MTPRDSDRREFLKAGAATGLALAAAAATGAAAQTNPPAEADAVKKNEGGIPLRQLGKTGEWVTLLGLGGHHSTRAREEADKLRLIQRAVDEGITFLDNAWDYHDGKCEEWMGKALEQGKLRDKVFLMTKCCGRTAKDAQAHLEDSLRRLRTDHLDLWQFHEICYDNDPDWIFAAGGAIEYALKAKEQGKIRHLGFTGHKDPRIHLKMLSKPYDWAAVQMPLNVMDSQYRSFQRQVLPVLNQRGIGAIAMKSLGGDGGIVSKAGISIEDALQYVFSLPIATLVSGMESEKILEQNLKIVREFTPLPAGRMVQIQSNVFGLAGDGRFELFKSSNRYDGPYHRKQHGFSVDA